MTKQQILERLKNQPTRNKIQEILDSPEFDLMLQYAELSRGSYSLSAKPSPHPHVQQENNGGVKGWSKLKYLLMQTITRVEKDLRNLSSDNQEKEEPVEYDESY